MLDYYTRVHSLSEEKLVDEIEGLNRKISKMKNPNTAMFEQLISMLEVAQSAYQESMIKRRIKAEDTVLNIGDIQGEVYQPDYSTEKIMDVLVQGYLDTPKRNNSESN